MKRDTMLNDADEMKLAPEATEAPMEELSDDEIESVVGGLIGMLLPAI